MNATCTATAADCKCTLPADRHRIPAVAVDIPRNHEVAGVTYRWPTRLLLAAVALIALLLMAECGPINPDGGTTYSVPGR